MSGNTNNRTKQQLQLLIGGAAALFAVGAAVIVTRWWFAKQTTPSKKQAKRNKIAQYERVKQEAAPGQRQEAQPEHQPSPQQPAAAAAAAAASPPVNRKCSDCAALPQLCTCCTLRKALRSSYSDAFREAHDSLAVSVESVYTNLRIQRDVNRQANSNSDSNNNKSDEVDESKGELINATQLPERVAEAQQRGVAVVAVEGLAGTGKSRLAQQLAVEQNFVGALVIFVPLRDLIGAERIDSVADLLALVCEDILGKSKQKMIAEHKVPCCFIVDGLDEVQHTAADKVLTDFLKHFVDPRRRQMHREDPESDYAALVRPCDLVVVTSRPERVQNSNNNAAAASSGFSLDREGHVDFWVMQRWRDEDVERYCTKWFTKFKPPIIVVAQEGKNNNQQQQAAIVAQATRDVVETLRSLEMETFKGIPLYVSLLCEIRYDAGNTNHFDRTAVSPSTIFELFIEVTWKRNRQRLEQYFATKPQFRNFVGDDKVFQDLLNSSMRSACKHAFEQFTDPNARQITALQFPPDKIPPWTEFWRVAGILQLRGRTACFSHRSFIEALVARYVAVHPEVLDKRLEQEQQQQEEQGEEEKEDKLQEKEPTYLIRISAKYVNVWIYLVDHARRVTVFRNPTTASRLHPVAARLIMFEQRLNEQLLHVVIARNFALEWRYLCSLSFTVQGRFRKEDTMNLLLRILASMTTVTATTASPATDNTEEDDDHFYDHNQVTAASQLLDNIFEQLQPSPRRDFTKLVYTSFTAAGALDAGRWARRTDEQLYNAGLFKMLLYLSQAYLRGQRELVISGRPSVARCVRFLTRGSTPRIIVIHGAGSCIEMGFAIESWASGGRGFEPMEDKMSLQVPLCFGSHPIVHTVLLHLRRVLRQKHPSWDDFCRTGLELDPMQLALLANFFVPPNGAVFEIFNTETKQLESITSDELLCRLDAPQIQPGEWVELRYRTQREVPLHILRAIEIPHNCRPGRLALQDRWPATAEGLPWLSLRVCAAASCNTEREVSQVKVFRDLRFVRSVNTTFRRFFQLCGESLQELYLPFTRSTATSGRDDVAVLLTVSNLRRLSLGCVPRQINWDAQLQQRNATPLALEHIDLVLDDAPIDDAPIHERGGEYVLNDDIDERMEDEEEEEEEQQSLGSALLAMFRALRAAAQAAQPPESLRSALLAMLRALNGPQLKTVVLRECDTEDKFDDVASVMHDLIAQLNLVLSFSLTTIGKANPSAEKMTKLRNVLKMEWKHEVV